MLVSRWVKNIGGLTPRGIGKNPIIREQRNQSMLKLGKSLDEIIARDRSRVPCLRFVYSSFCSPFVEILRIPGPFVYRTLLVHEKWYLPFTLIPWIHGIRANNCSDPQMQANRLPLPLEALVSCCRETFSGLGAYNVKGWPKFIKEMFKIVYHLV